MELERCGDGGIALLELVFCRRGGKGVGMEVERCGDCGVACSAAAARCSARREMRSSLASGRSVSDVR